MDIEKWRAMISMAVKQARQITDDQEALSVKYLYKEWVCQIGRVLKVGEYIQHDDKLYKVLQQHTAQENWMPGEGTESLYIVVDKLHEGTLEDPIPWMSNMECFLGKYYIEDEVIYECIRNSEIALQHKASELIGDYFDIYNDMTNETRPEVKPGVRPEDKEEDFESNEKQEGTIENPINVVDTDLPIAYELDKYYKENDVIYKCIRAETLHFLPSSLVGNYFEIV